MNKKKYNNESITETLFTTDMLSGISFATTQPDYPLSAADYMQLKNGWVSVYGWALNVGFATFGYALSIFPKVFSGFLGGNEVVNKGEWITLGVGVVLMLGLCLLGFVLPNDKKNIMKAIKDHFKTAPKTRQAVRH